MGGTSVIRRAGVVAVLALSAALVPLVEQGSARGCDQRDDENTFRVTTTFDRSPYRVGDTVYFEVLVERDLKATVEPAEKVDVAVAIDVKGRVVFGTAVTNESGIAHVEVLLKRHLPAGKGDVGVGAWKEHIETPCTLLREVGTETLERAITVRK